MVLFRIAASVVLALCSLWAAAALYMDLRVAKLRLPVALLFVVLVALVMFKIRLTICAILDITASSTISRIGKRAR